MQTNFTADKVSITNLLSFVFAKTDCRIYEAYSEFDKELREFKSIQELDQAFDLGIDKNGHGFAHHLALWSPSAMPSVNIQRIALKMEQHQFRYTIEGCGLFTLHLGGLYKGKLTKSCLLYWSQAGAYQRCSVKPGPETVNWPAYKKLGALLSRQARRMANAG